MKTKSVDCKEILVGVYGRYGAEGIVAGLQGANGVKARKLTAINRETLLSLDVLCLSALTAIPEPELILSYIKSGCGVIFTHNACGRYDIASPLPKLWKYSAMGKENMLRVCASHPITHNLPKTFSHSYSDHACLKVGLRGKTLVKDNAGNPVVIVGTIGKGRVMAMGNLPGLDQADLTAAPQEGELALLINALKWLAAGSSRKLAIKWPSRGITHKKMSTGDDGKSRLFPPFTLPQRLCVCDLSEASAETRFMLTTLQGVVNRTNPCVYLIYNSWPEGMKSDDLWLDYYAAKGIEINRGNSVPGLIRMFVNELKGFIVYDPKLPDSANIATTMAGIENAIVAHPEAIGLLKKCGLKPLHDLRGRWRDKYAAYRWALARLWPKCNHRILGSMAYPSDKLYGIEVRDYLTAARSFVFNFYPDSKDEDGHRARSLFNELTSLAEPQSTILGWITTFPGEGRYVGEISKHGHHVLCTTFCPNLSVHAGVPCRSPYRQSHIIRARRKLERKIYVSLRISDGDSPAIMLKWHSGHWLDKHRGLIPLGWEVQPLLTEMAPAVLGYYYETATPNDCLMCGVSGAGYCHPSMLPNLDLFCKRTGRLMKQCDLKTIQVGDQDLYDSTPLYNRRTLSKLFRASGADGIFVCGKGKIHVQGDRVVIPTPLTWTTCNKVKEYLERASLEDGRPKFLSFLLSCYTTKLKEVYDLSRSLPSNTYEFVRPDEMVSLVRQAVNKKWLPCS
ncbi:MAG: GxGYxYP family putative glycoside hydrolase [Kiritimatiellae bacterium]|nr:GxGYxYP family putative glycoside hydrolase [Kiritimatiellia bacterium]